jgi:putative nucleotidyltransferase with HDIG domain
VLSAATLEQRIANLPPLPAAATDALRQLRQTEVNFERLECALCADPALAARVLTVANSPFYGLSGQVASVGQACMVLGAHTTRNIVLAVGVMCALPGGRGHHLDLKRLWQHAAGCAAAAQALAAAAGLERDTAFTAGLLHDVGKLVLDIHFADDYAAVVARCRRHGGLLVDAERAVLGLDHADVGAACARRWKLPASIVNVIGRHHDPRGFDEPLLCAVHVADVVCRALELGDGGDDTLPALEEAALRALNLRVDDVAALFPEIETSYVASGALVTQ